MRVNGRQSQIVAFTCTKQQTRWYLKCKLPLVSCQIPSKWFKQTQKHSLITVDFSEWLGYCWYGVWVPCAVRWTLAVCTDKDFFGMDNLGHLKIFFWKDSSSCSNSWNFFWTNNPINSNGIQSITNRWQTDDKQEANSFKGI